VEKERERFSFPVTANNTTQHWRELETMDKTIATTGKPQSEPGTTHSVRAGLKRRNPALGKMVLMGCLFLLPTFVLMTYTSFIPTIWNLILSFQNSTLFTSAFVGLANYLTAFQDPVFLLSLWHSIFVTVVITFFSTVIGVALAVLIYPLGRKEAAFYRVCIFLPVMLPTSIVGLMFIFVFDQQVGLLNNLLTLIGLGGLTQAWLAQPPLNLFAICVVGIWKTVGLPMILTSAALQSLPGTYFEAAKIDGAGFLRQIFSLILPLIKPIIAISVTFSLIINFKTFDLVYVLTRGGPGNSTFVVPIDLLQTAFTDGEFGYAAAFGIILAVTIFLVVAVSNRVMKSERYEY
jgi:raffinose/stachyose/melibiose transport system permease protein